MIDRCVELRCCIRGCAWGGGQRPRRPRRGSPSGRPRPRGGPVTPHPLNRSACPLRMHVPNRSTPPPRPDEAKRQLTPNKKENKGDRIPCVPNTRTHPLLLSTGTVLPTSVQVYLYLKDWGKVRFGFGPPHGQGSGPLVPNAVAAAGTLLPLGGSVSYDGPPCDEPPWDEPPCDEPPCDEPPCWVSEWWEGANFPFLSRSQRSLRCWMTRQPPPPARPTGPSHPPYTTPVVRFVTRTIPGSIRRLEGSPPPLPGGGAHRCPTAEGHGSVSCGEPPPGHGHQWGGRERASHSGSEANHPFAVEGLDPTPQTHVPQEDQSSTTHRQSPFGPYSGQGTGQKRG